MFLSRNFLSYRDRPSHKDESAVDGPQRRGPVLEEGACFREGELQHCNWNVGVQGAASLTHHGMERKGGAVSSRLAAKKIQRMPVHAFGVVDLRRGAAGDFQAKQSAGTVHAGCLRTERRPRSHHPALS